MLRAVTLDMYILRKYCQTIEVSWVRIRLKVWVLPPCKRLLTANPNPSIPDLSICNPFPLTLALPSRLCETLIPSTLRFQGYKGIPNARAVKRVLMTGGFLHPRRNFDVELLEALHITPLMPNPNPP